MIDQPEIILADDSKYKGFKPSDATQLAEALRGALISHFEEAVVNQPGDDTLYFRAAISNVRL